MSETKRKVAAGKSHGSCGSAPRNYGSCHGCSFVDGVFAPRGGCPNHEPRKLHPLPIPLPLLLRLPILSRSPENHPFPPLRLPPSTFATNFPIPYSPYSHSRRRLTPWYRRGSIDALARSSRDDLSKIGKLTIVNRHSFLHTETIRFSRGSILLHNKLSPSSLQPVYYQRCSIHVKWTQSRIIQSVFNVFQQKIFLNKWHKL